MEVFGAMVVPRNTYKREKIMSNGPIIEKILMTLVKDCPNEGSGECAFVHTCVKYNDKGDVVDE